MTDEIQDVEKRYTEIAVALNTYSAFLHAEGLRLLSEISNLRISMTNCELSHRALVEKHLAAASEVMESSRKLAETHNVVNAAVDRVRTWWDAMKDMKCADPACPFARHMAECADDGSAVAKDAGK